MKTSQQKPSGLSRREILQYSMQLAAVMGLSAALRPRFASAVEQLAAGATPVLWLQGLSCSGCSVSTLNAAAPTPAELITRYIALRFNSTLSAATGAQAMDVINHTIKKGSFVLVVEGALPVGMPQACVVGEEPVTDQVARAAGAAQAVIALGTCATYGGIPAAEGNPVGAASVPAFLKSKGIKTPLIALPGCPAHPDWLVGTIAHVARFGLPALDGEGRPKTFFRRVLHDQCPRFADYERENFAKHLADDGCLFKLGCVGPNTRADCTQRQWNGGTNMCIRAGAPCIGCAGKEFAAKKSFPLLIQGRAIEPAAPRDSQRSRP